jgi:hypothetical protein
VVGNLQGSDLVVALVVVALVLLFAASRPCRMAPIGPLSGSAATRALEQALHDRRRCTPRSARLKAEVARIAAERRGSDALRSPAMISALRRHRFGFCAAGS